MRIEAENTITKRIHHPEDVFEIIQKIFYQKKEEVDLMKEHFWAFSLNKSYKILNLELIGMGSKDRVIADPGDVFRVPLYKSSSYVVLVHNHPSGSLQPSSSDIDLTNRLMKAGDILDVKVIEHVIVTETSYFSFKKNGLIEKLEIDTDYALSFIYEKRMKAKMDQLKAEAKKEHKKGKLEGVKAGKQAGIQEGMKKRNQEIAREMLIRGMDTATIEEITGLSRPWIGRIKSELVSEKV